MCRIPVFAIYVIWDIISEDSVSNCNACVGKGTEYETVFEG
jgi:hypothetical protein